MSSYFLTDDFLLQGKHAKNLYHDYVKNLPIIDYHCHLPPDEIANNKQFANLTEIWLKGDHYKWRAQRTLGVNEDFITGSASDELKFHHWARSSSSNGTQSFVSLDPYGVEECFWR